MADVWLFGTFYCTNRLNTQDTKDYKVAKWRSQSKVPQGSAVVGVYVAGAQYNWVQIELNGVWQTHAIYLTDLEYQLRDTTSKLNSRWCKFTNSSNRKNADDYLWYRAGTVTDYQIVTSGSSNPNPPNPNPFVKPVPTSKPLIDLGYLNFVEQRLELGFDYGAVGGAAFETEVVEVSSGREQRNANRYLPLGRWQLGDRSLLESDIEAIKEVSYLKDFHGDRKGSYQGFRFKDWSDFQAFDQLIGIGDGATSTYQLHKAYGVGSAIFYRPILKPVATTFLFNLQFLPNGYQIAVDLDATTGVVTLDQALPLGALLFASFEFDIPVWFESDQIGFRLEGYQEETDDDGKTKQTAIYKLESVFVVEGRTPIDNWVAEPLQQIEQPLDLGIIYETTQQHEFLTVKQELKSGYVKRISKQAQSQLSFNLGSRNYDLAEIAQILSYFWLAKGKLRAFPFKNLGEIYTVRFDQDELNLKFEAALVGDDEVPEERFFSLPGLKLQVLPTVGLLKYISVQTTVYFCLDSSASGSSSLPEIQSAIAQWQYFLNGNNYDLTFVELTYSHERWLKVVNDNFAPNALYLIWSSEAAPFYHSTLTFTPAGADFETDKTNFLDAFETRENCKILVHSLSSPGSAFDIFNGQLFAASEGLLGYSPALKNYGLDVVLNIDPDTDAEQWLNYFKTEAIATDFLTGGGNNSLFPATGLIHYYSLETLPPLNDLAGNSPLTAINATLGVLVPCVRGNGLFYQYGGDGFGGNALRDANASLSLSFWYQADLANDGDVIFADQYYSEDSNGSVMAYFSAGKVALWLIHDDYSTSNPIGLTPIDDGFQHHIVLTFDIVSKDIKLYIDNIQQFLVSNGKGLNFSSQFLYFNVAIFVAGAGFTTFDEIGIWNIALTSNQIADLYNNGAGSFFSS